METPIVRTDRSVGVPVAVDASDGNRSGVSWGAIFVGAAAAASLSLVLIILGFGLGLSAISPWSQHSASAETMGVSTIVWLALTQIAASALGGYLAGRLRVKWVSLHTDEVYFRDTAHGFMAWSVASLATAAFLTTAVSAAIGTAAQAGATIASGVGVAGVAVMRNSDTNRGTEPAGPPNEIGYFVDSLFRSDASQPIDLTASDAAHREALSIFAVDIKNGALPPADKTYLGQVVAKQTGLNQADAEARVADQYTRLQSAISTAEDKAKQTADKARKAAKYSSLWMFVALMCGAFFASLAATFGGKRRDHVV